MAFFGQCECGEDDCGFCGPVLALIRSKKEIRSKAPTWKTREGDVILIENMKDSHLLNTIKMLQRNEHTTHESYTDLIKEAEKRKIIK